MVAMSKIPTEVSEYMSKIGKRGGKSKSERKLRALKKNSRKGGWGKWWRDKEAAKKNGNGRAD